jgi:regulator of replication initiation timing
MMTFTEELIQRWETSSNGLISAREAITALEEMQKHIAGLSYENECHILARKQDKQRIEELEQRSGDDEIATAVNVALQQRIEELEKDIDKVKANQWASYERAERLQIENKRLDAALADADWLALKISEGNFNQAEVIKKSREFLKARTGE